MLRCLLLVCVLLGYVLSQERQIVSRFTSNVIVKMDATVAYGTSWFDFDRRLFHIKLKHLDENKIMQQLTVMTEEAPGQKSHTVYAITGPVNGKLKCDVWGHINTTIIPDEFSVPHTASFEGYQKKNGEHSAKWTFTVANPKPSYHQTTYTEFDMHFTLFLSRFDQTIVDVVVDPSPLGKRIAISTFNGSPSIPEEFVLHSGPFALPTGICQRL